MDRLTTPPSNPPLANPPTHFHVTFRKICGFDLIAPQVPAFSGASNCYASFAARFSSLPFEQCAVSSKLLLPRPRKASFLMFRYLLLLNEVIKLAHPAEAIAR
jgi:hypothetical protein